MIRSALARTGRFAVVFVLGIGTVGCVSFGGGRSSRAPARYYEIHATPGPARSHSLPHTLAIRSFSEDGALDRESIRHRPSAVEGGYWTDSRWSQSVSGMVRAAANADLEAANLFRRVVLIENIGAADLILDGRVNRFEEVDEPDGAHALAVVTFDCSSAASGQVLYHRRIEEDVKCGSRSPDDIVKGLSKAVDEMMSELTTGLADAVSQHK